MQYLVSLGTIEQQGVLCNHSSLMDVQCCDDQWLHHLVCRDVLVLHVIDGIHNNGFLEHGIQAYVNSLLLTGRQDRFHQLMQQH